MRGLRLCLIFLATPIPHTPSPAWLGGLCLAPLPVWSVRLAGRFVGGLRRRGGLAGCEMHCEVKVHLLARPQIRNELYVERTAAEIDLYSCHNMPALYRYISIE